MSKSTCHSRLPSTATTPDLDFPNLMETSADLRRPSSISDRRATNVNYVRHVLRKFFGGHNKKYSSSAVFDDLSYEPSPTASSTGAERCISPILIHPCLQFEKHTKFSGRIAFYWPVEHSFPLFRWNPTRLAHASLRESLWQCIIDQTSHSPMLYLSDFIGCTPARKWFHEWFISGMTKQISTICSHCSYATHSRFSRSPPGRWSIFCDGKEQNVGKSKRWSDGARSVLGRRYSSEGVEDLVLARR